MQKNSNSMKGYASSLAKDLDAAFDRLHASYKMKPPKPQPQAEQKSKPTSAADQPVNLDPEPSRVNVAKKGEDKPEVKVAENKPEVKVAEKPKPESVQNEDPGKTFDTNTKNEILSLLVSNKLNVLEVLDSSITFEFNDSKLVISPQ